MMTPLDLSTSAGGGGKKLLAIALIGAALLVAGMLAVRQWVPRDDPTVVQMPSEYHFRCTRCDHRWTADRSNVTDYFGGGLPTTLRPVTCPSCGAQEAAYLMVRCPWCGKHHVPEYLLKGAGGRPKQDICPHCRKDTMKWHR